MKRIRLTKPIASHRQPGWSHAIGSDGVLVSSLGNSGSLVEIRVFDPSLEGDAWYETLDAKADEFELIISPESILDCIDRRLDDVLRYPQAWGGAAALEPLVLMLALLRTSVSDQRISDRAVLDDYLAFLNGSLGPGNGDISSRIGLECTVDRMAEILRDYVIRLRSSHATQICLSPQDLLRIDAEATRWRESVDRGTSNLEYFSPIASTVRVR